MYTFVTASKEQHLLQIREMFREYLQSMSLLLQEKFGLSIDNVDDYVENDIQHIDQFMAPTGRLLLCYLNEIPVGMAALKGLTPEMGEIKRMYVRPEHRRKGLGRALLFRLMDEAVHLGFQTMRLDSPRFAHESHQLYRATGFRDIQPYEGSEVPKEIREHWIFMEMKLPGSKISQR